MKKLKLNIKRILIGLVLVSVVYIVAADLDNSQTKRSGAGDIWWAGVPEIHEIYDNLNSK
ncbi:hypothetical protein EDC18_10629 [Natranaerovirga pectinivora]|uniref:Uncharacterized protein n=1 Tax=Natranaerovirga pectinivora TaxID=682400 RepID=A0A4R3MKK8_9FIRM|nr:hypothetical protein [Natranaerovirga pectinivora]TCT14233.1 hypothetical protein EDC18_10629 [Natranaerovirga pectinivora]